MSVQSQSPEVTGEYLCGACGNRAKFVGVDERGYPGDDCDCGEEECECRVTLRQSFRIDEDSEVDYDAFEGGGCGAEIGDYTTIFCGVCEAVVWTEGPRCTGSPSVERGGRVVSEPCPDAATTTREGWRWGDREKGEDVIVKTTHPLCERCARAWDDNRAEAAAEAAAS